MRRSKKGKNDAKAQEVQAVWDDDERRNQVELEAVKLTARRTMNWRVIIVAFLIGELLLGFVAFRASSNVQTIGTALGERFRELAADKPGREAAVESVNSWLTSGAFPDGTDNLLWDDAVKVGETQTDDGGTSVTVEWWSHQLEFTDLSDGSTRVVTQLISVKDGISTAVGSPTVMSKRVEQGNTSTTTYTPDGYGSVDQSESLTNSLSQWATAYVGSDPTTLTVLIGDPDPAHAYQPAAVGKFSNLSVNWLVECTEDGQPVSREDSSDNPEYGAASVTITYEPYYTPADADDATRTRPSVTMNITLLVRTPSQGSARVVDWGADGSVDTLSPYSHAVDSTMVDRSSGSDDTDTSAARQQPSDATDEGQDAEQPSDASEPTTSQ